MKGEKLKLGITLPVLMSYIVMGFVDIVGVSTGYIQKSFALDASTVQLIPSMVFIWFFLLSVPVGLLQERFGKRHLLITGILLTGVGMIFPFTGDSFQIMLVSFTFLGIGNTIIQVAANPLLKDVVPENRFSSFMSLSQFVKAIVSTLGPLIAAFAAIKFGNWKLVFLIYAVVSFATAFWLAFTKIEEFRTERNPATFKSCFGLLSDKFILIMVIGIFLVVGADVGMNTNIQGFLSQRAGLSLEKASIGISIYFIALMLSRFSGTILLNYIKPAKFLLYSACLAVLGVVTMMVSKSSFLAYFSIFVVGLGAGNLFPLIFSVSVAKKPERANEISGLMIMAIVGGAIVPLLMGVISKNFGIVAGISVLVFCMVYLVISSFYVNRHD